MITHPRKNTSEYLYTDQALPEIKTIDIRLYHLLNAISDSMSSGRQVRLPTLEKGKTLISLQGSSAHLDALTELCPLVESPLHRIDYDLFRRVDWWTRLDCRWVDLVLIHCAACAPWGCRRFGCSLLSEDFFCLDFSFDQLLHYLYSSFGCHLEEKPSDSHVVWF